MVQETNKFEYADFWENCSYIMPCYCIFPNTVEV